MVYCCINPDRPVRSFPQGNAALFDPDQGGYIVQPRKQNRHKPRYLYRPPYLAKRLKFAAGIIVALSLAAMALMLIVSVRS
jgi:hypothetical protein